MAYVFASARALSALAWAPEVVSLAFQVDFSEALTVSPLTAIVILSVVASEVKTILEPATNSNVSVALSAATVVVPTLTFENAFWFTYSLCVCDAGVNVEGFPVTSLQAGT